MRKPIGILCVVALCASFAPPAMARIGGGFHGGGFGHGGLRHYGFYGARPNAWRGRGGYGYASPYGFGGYGYAYPNDDDPGTIYFAPLIRTCGVFGGFC